VPDVPFGRAGLHVATVILSRRSGAFRVRRDYAGPSWSAAVDDKHQAVPVRIDEHSRPGPRPVRVECGIVGWNLMMSGGSETIGEIDDLVTVREIQDEDVFYRRCRRERLAWRDELELGAFVGQTQDDAVEPVVVREGPQDAESNDAFVEVA
jgi:hypothetical protein